MDELILMRISLTARKHLVLTTPRDMKYQVMLVGEVAFSILSSTKREVMMISSTPVLLLVKSIQYSTKPMTRE